MKFQRAVATLATALLILLAVPARADSVQFQNLAWSGTYQGLVPGGVVVGTPWGSVLLPQGLSFSVGGNRIDLSSLNVGSPLWVHVPNLPGQVVGAYGDVVYVQYPMGVVPVPANLLGDMGGRAKVTVLKRNGKTVQVPLNAALNMQRAQGAVILGASPLVGWPAGVSGPSILLGSQGEHLLLQAVVNQVPRLVRVPRSAAGALAQARPNTLLEVRPQGDGLGWGPWHGTGRGHEQGDQEKHGQGKEGHGHH